MSSNERLALIGKKTELEDIQEKITIKLKGYSKLLIDNSSILFFEDYELMDDKSIKVYSEELILQIKELRKLRTKLKEITALIGDED